jgi:hypothetical protein
MAKKIILGVRISDRVKCVPEVQEALTEFGCNIRTRLGLHDVDDKSCSSAGLIILETFGPEKKITAIENRLKKIKGLKVRKMIF